MSRCAQFSVFVAAWIIVSRGVVVAEGMPDAGAWTAFDRSEIAGLEPGGLRMKSNAAMDFARGVSTQAVYVVKGKPEMVAQTLRTFDPTRHPELEVFQQRMFRVEGDARFSELKIDASAASFRKLLAEMSAPKTLQISREERARLPHRPGAAEAQHYWSALLAERWSRFARDGAFAASGTFNAGEEIASLLAGEPKMALHFDSLIHPWTRAGGARGSSAAMHYWDVSSTDGLANVELGAIYERANDGRIQYADVTYYTSSGYLAAVSLFEFIPIAGPAAPQTLVWQGTLVSAADVAGALGLKRKFAVHTVEEEMRTWIGIFRRACAAGGKMNRRRKLVALVLALASITLGAPALRAGAPASIVEAMQAPALDVLETSVTAVGRSRMPLPRGGSIEQSALEADFEFTRRIGLGGDWYVAFGLSYEGYFFGDTAGGLPSRLQGIAGIFALQYLIEDHVAATIEVRPGVYAGGEITSDALDVPVLAYAPIPLRSNLFLVVGARVSGLEKPPVTPVGGFVWLIRDDLRLEAMFPQSQFVYSLDERWEYVVTAEVAGDGFRLDRDPALPARLRGAAVEYLEDRAGTGVNFTPCRGSTIGLEAGYVIERSLDFFRVRQDLRSGGSLYLRLQGSLEF